MIIKAKIGDNSNPDYSETVYTAVSDDLWNKYKNLDEDNDDDYWTKRNEYWNRLCNAVDRQHALPPDWYVEKDFEECKEGE